MIKEAIQFKEYIEINCPNLFEMKEVENGLVIFSHRERQMNTMIQFNKFAKMRVSCFAVVTYCAKEEKKDELILYLNEINKKTIVKFFLAEDGNVMAQVDYFHKETFLPELAINILKLMLDTISNGIYDEIMKIIWS